VRGGDRKSADTFEPAATNHNEGTQRLINLIHCSHGAWLDNGGGRQNEIKLRLPAGAVDVETPIVAF